MKNEIVSFLTQYWPEISVLVYELFVRLLPTSKNLSIVDLILKLTGKTLELTQKGVDKVVPNNQKNTLKSFLVFALLSLSIGANAQLNLNAKTLRLTDNVAAKDTVANAVDGQIYFNHNTQKLRLYSNSAWGDVASGGGGLTTASNGLSVSGNDVRLGGTLTQNTTIAQSGFNTTFNGNGKVTFSPTVGTVAGLNVGSIAGDVASPANGDLWYNSTTQKYKVRNTALGTLNITTDGGLSNSRIPFATVSGGITSLVDDADLSFNMTTNVLTNSSGAIVNNNSSYNFRAYSTSDSQHEILSWVTSTVANAGVLTQGFNIFLNSAFAAIEDKTALVEYNVLLTKSDGSDGQIKKILVGYRKDGAANPVQVGAATALISVGNATPTVTFSISGGGLPEININDNGSGGWKVKVWAEVSISN